MPIWIQGEQVIVPGGSFAVSKFPGLVRAHLHEVLCTMTIEAEGLRLVSRGLPRMDLERFIRHVCTWGGYRALAGRIIATKNNHPSTIRDAFTKSVAQLCDKEPRPETALQLISRVKGLGRPSFASKHLRFLSPKFCPTFDSKIAKNFNYPHNFQGYSEFASDCSTVGAQLKASGIENPMGRDEARWFTSDVEMALFAFLNRWEEPDPDIFKSC
jgi:hypothetical protein